MTIETHDDLIQVLETDGVFECPRGAFFGGVFQVVEELIPEQIEEARDIASIEIHDTLLASYEVQSSDNQEPAWYVLLQEEDPRSHRVRGDSSLALVRTDGGDSCYDRAENMERV